MNEKIQNIINNTPSVQYTELFIKLRQECEDKLKSFNFFQADEYQEIFPNLKIYEELKVKYIIKYFKSNFGICLNTEQAAAIAKIGNNIKITARAGSGKTRTIISRAIYALEKENIKPNEILLLAFNTDAVNEMIFRLNKYNKITKDNIRTFHSEAYRIKPHSDILLNYEDEDITYNDQNSFIQQNVINKILDDKFKVSLYNCIKNMGYDDHIEKIHVNKNYLLYRKNRKLITLNGEKVKSEGEKWIADFLFEHDIPYKYEKLLTQNGRLLYKPDFTLFINSKEYILEHWGIDENDETKKVPEYWSKSWDEYQKEMIWKRELVKRKNYTLIETNLSEKNKGRNEFEKILKQKLENSGIKCIKNKEPIEKLIKYKKFKINKDFINFINIAKQNKYTPEKISEILNVNKESFTKYAYDFLVLANIVYNEYEKQLNKENKTDFNDILKNAIQEIHMTKGTCEIRLGNNFQQVKNIKLILIDEFQDFSFLFYELISAIKQYNPNLKLFCVGDDWQSINSFAGSNLEYFNDNKNFENINLLKNYRSKSAIINLGNKLMKNRGPEVYCCSSTLYSRLNKTENIKYINSVYYNIEDNNDMRFQFDNNYYGIASRYLKLCYETILNETRTKTKDFIIVSRTKHIDNVHIEDFENKLKYLLPKYKKNIKVNTIHKFKGMEADIVIILECNNNKFPLIHPNWEFAKVFGKDINYQLEEERRLFYVAITRAKENVYFLSENNNLTDYIKECYDLFTYDNLNNI